MMAIYSQDQIERLWQLRLYNGTRFNNRLHLFLVSESILIAIVGSLINSNNPNTPALLLFILFGIALTILWRHIQSKEMFLLNLSKDMCTKCMPEYKKYRKASKRDSWPLSTTCLLTNCVPSLIGLIWLTLALYVLT